MSKQDASTCLLVQRAMTREERLKYRQELTEDLAHARAERDRIAREIGQIAQGLESKEKTELLKTVGRELEALEARIQRVAEEHDVQSFF